MVYETTSGYLTLKLLAGSPPSIYASGELDYQNCGNLCELIEHTLVEHGPTLKLALGDLGFIDSSGLRVLITSALNAREAGGSLIIDSMSTQLARMLNVSGFGELFILTSDNRREQPFPEAPLNTPFHLFEVPACVDACRDVRNKVCEYSSSIGFNATAIDDIKLAVGEAMSNAVRHGCCSSSKPITVRCNLRDDRLIISLRYPSEEFDPCLIPKPTVDSGCNGGMGIFFMKLVMDNTTYTFEDGYATLVLEKRLTDANKIE